MNPEMLDSDSSDEDYVPDKKIEDSSSGLDSEEGINQADSPNEKPQSKSKKRKKNSYKCKKKLKDIDHPDISDFQATEEDKKQKEDDVWADFMKDTGFKSKSECISNSVTKTLPPINKNESKATDENKPKKVIVTEVFNFAGENISVEKEIQSGSEVPSIKQVSTSKTTKLRGNESKSQGGIGGILSQLSKKNKISTLEKSKLDWDQFKREENLAEELQSFNRGKDGYLEKQDFLNRADLRRFEIERELRTVERNKRVNNI